ncbi:ATP-dependent DNA helicase [Catenovulum sp. 2E275]|uniref:ATP-dependent DNA helicase n=1 Tax=Catenovulum sp. 2E275 TaxID=2980497 RepID=UPI0021CF638E|nr:ATP-dependent DNA helicase [Catenovulum sp. 2E275]MCU4676971.1 ATP-dependent DNA helicase [Catenovulum sp. 2E275]
MTKLDQVFSKDGALAKVISGYQPRQAQLQLAEAFASAIKNKDLLIAEAGTGTGKTFAYLIPALLSEQKVIISTGTKNLQEQLYHRDLPVVKRALVSKAKTALLKGRGNYLCLLRHKQQQSPELLQDKSIAKDLKQITRWAVATQSGDIGEVTSIAEDSKAIPLVTSTIDNCLGKECPDYNDCYLVKARKKAADADLVVINHHLYFADMAVKNTGFGEIVPDSQVVVFDEAHQIPDIACEYFGQRLSTRQLVELAKDIEAEYRTELKDIRQLGKAADKLQTSAKQFRLAFPIDPEKGNWRDKGQSEEFSQHIEHLSQAMEFCYEVIKLAVGRTKNADHLFDRIVQAKATLERLTQWHQSNVSLWYETTPRHAMLNLTPLSIADKFANLRTDKKQAWLMTSATLAVDGKFDHFTDLLGLNEFESLSLESPFDYQNQSLLCIPRYFPEPHERSVLAELKKMAIELINASQGRCFFLFTSHRMMNLMAKSLKSAIDNPILVQGEVPKRKLLEQYLAESNPVLLATGSFWEGVDVRGDALKCVIIDKLPFAAPDDPLTQARIENCRRNGQDPFNKIQIPQAVITLKQGAGRLIRDVKDKGVLVICDPRLVSRPYGEIFLQSLPDMKRTRTLSIACDFLQQS